MADNPTTPGDREMGSVPAPREAPPSREARPAAPQLHTPLPASRYDPKRFCIDSSALPTQTVEDLRSIRSWGVFRRFAEPTVELEFRRFAHHAGLWPSVATFVLAFVAYTYVSVVNDRDSGAEYAIFAIAAVCGVCATCQVYLQVAFSCKSFQDEHRRGMLWQLLEVLGRTACAALGALALQGRSVQGTCLRPIPAELPPPELCSDSFSWGLFVWVLLMFANIFQPLHALLGALFVALPTVVLTMVFDETGSFPTFLVWMRTVCYVITIFAFTWNAVIMDNARRDNFCAMCEVSFVDNAFETHKARIVNVVKAALPEKLASRLARCSTVPFPLDAVYDACDTATVVVTSAVDFGSWSSHRLQTVVMAALHHLFTIFDEGQKIFGVDHGTTFGDCYVATVGLIRGRSPNPANAIRFARWQLLLRENAVLCLHSAIATGPLMGGIAGAKGLRYVLAGAALNEALALLRIVPPNNLWVTTTTKQAADFGRDTTVQFLPLANSLVNAWCVAPITNGDGTASVIGNAPSVAAFSELGTDLEYARASFGLLESSSPTAMDGGAKTEVWERYHLPTLNNFCGTSESTPKDERLYRQQAISQLRNHLPQLGVASAVLYSCMLVALQLSISQNELPYRRSYIGASAMLAFCFVVSVAAPVSAVVIPKWFSTFVPLTYGVTVFIVGGVALIGAGALLLASETFIANDPSYLALLQIMPIVYTVCRPMTMLQALAFTTLVCVIPSGYLILSTLGTAAASPYVQLLFNALVALTECRHGPYVFRVNFALTYQLAAKKVAMHRTINTLVSLISDMVPPHVVDAGVAALDRQTIEHVFTGVACQSAVSQLQAKQSVFHEIEVLEDMADFVMVHVKIGSHTSVASGRHRGGGMRPALLPTEGGLLEAAARVAAEIAGNKPSSGGAPKHASVALREPGKAAERRDGPHEVTPLEVLTLWHRISLLTAQVSMGSLHHIQSLGDEFTLGGPFVGPTASDANIQTSCAAAVLFLQALYSQLHVVFTACITLDEASGALVGRGALRYRVFGEAARQGAALLKGTPDLADRPIAIATRNVVRCIAPSLLRAPLNPFEALAWQMMDMRMYFLRSQRCCVRGAGLTHVYPLYFPDAYAPPPAPASAAPNDAMPGGGGQDELVDPEALAAQYHEDADHEACTDDLEFDGMVEEENGAHEEEFSTGPHSDVDREGEEDT